MNSCHHCGDICALENLHYWKGQRLSGNKRAPDLYLCAECSAMHAATVRDYRSIGGHVAR